MAPSGWAPRLLGLFQARRWGWDKGGASGKPPKKCPGNFESALPLFLDRTVGSSPLLTLNPEPPSPRAPGASPLRSMGPGASLLPQTQGCRPSHLRPQSSSLRPRGLGTSLLPQTQGSRHQPPPSDPRLQAPVLLLQTHECRPRSPFLEPGVQVPASSLRPKGPDPSPPPLV